MAKLTATRLAIPEVLLIEPQVFDDQRGFFFESYNQQEFRALSGVHVSFVQDNHSRSRRNVLRGLHFQRQPAQQGKLVRATRGSIFDVVVDIRPQSPSFGRWVAQTLSEGNRHQLWIPAGFAHGFLALEDDTEVQYKATSHYDPSTEGSIRWDDPVLAIEWPSRDVVLNAKDADAPPWSECFQ